MLSGNSYGLYFSVDFDVDETELRVQTLRINIGESIKTEIAEFVERSVSIEWFLDGYDRKNVWIPFPNRIIYTKIYILIHSVENECNLPGFFKGFVQYAKLNHQRTMLFDALKR